MFVLLLICHHRDFAAVELSANQKLRLTYRFPAAIGGGATVKSRQSAKATEGETAYRWLEMEWGF